MIYCFRLFKGEAGLRVHQYKIAECVDNIKKAKMGKGRKEVWIVPSKEQRSPWENVIVTKEIYLGLHGPSTTEKNLSCRTK